MAQRFNFVCSNLLPVSFDYLNAIAAYEAAKLTPNRISWDSYKAKAIPNRKTRRKQLAMERSK
jgi:hypothetical protein